MSTPLGSLLITGDLLLVECSYCALATVSTGLEACVAFGEASSFQDVENGHPCPRCGIKNDARTRWRRAKVATPDDLLRIAHPGRGGGRGHGRAPRKRSGKRWAD